MKYLIVLSLIALLAACAETKETQTTSTSSTNVESEKSTEQIELNPLKSFDYTLQINQTALLNMSEHASVGSTSEVLIQDETILALVSDEFKYTKEPKEGMTGGDAGSRSYIFKALKTGQTSITAKDIYRGKLQSETIFNITVQ
jgi:predicted secreted protein